METQELTAGGEILLFSFQGSQVREQRVSRMEGQCSTHLSDFIAVEAGGEICCAGPKNMNLVRGQTL